jgi:hypothetical protein
MFDEIVGSSPALKSVLSGILKVAPTDSTVLITGETRYTQEFATFGPRFCCGELRLDSALAHRLRVVVCGHHDL